MQDSGQSQIERPFTPGKVVRFPKAACNLCPLRVQCTRSRHGRSISVHPDEALIDATGVEVLREILHRQRRGGGDLLLSGLGARVSDQLARSGLLDLLGRDRVFWSTDRAILSLHADLPLKPELVATDSDFRETLALTPHEERADSEW